MRAAEVKFGDWIQDGLNLYQAHIGLLLLVSLISWLLGLISFGLLAGPLAAGMIHVVLGLQDRREPRPDIGSLFFGFEIFLPAFLFVFVWGIASFLLSLLLNLLPCLGAVLSVFVGFAITALLSFGLFLIADRRQDFWSASMDSVEVVKTNFFPFLVLTLVTTILGAVGTLLCGVGVILTAPIPFCIWAVAYRDVFGRDDEDPAIYDEEPDGPLEPTEIIDADALEDESPPHPE